MNSPEPDNLPGYGNPFFDAVEYPDSPQPPNARWRGILISAPSQVVLTIKQPLLLVRGTYRIQGDTYPKDDTLYLAAFDTLTRKEYIQAAGQQDESPDEPPPPSDPEDPALVQRMVFSGYFNADLAGMLGLPWAPATYRVMARMGHLQSNQLVIRVDTK
jgi:hypothetical protein